MHAKKLAMEQWKIYKQIIKGKIYTNKSKQRLKLYLFNEYIFLIWYYPHIIPNDFFRNPHNNEHKGRDKSVNLQEIYFISCQMSYMAKGFTNGKNKNFLPSHPWIVFVLMELMIIQNNHNSWQFTWPESSILFIYFLISK